MDAADRRGPQGDQGVSARLPHAALPVESPRAGVLREYEDETVLVGREPRPHRQAVQLDLARFAGARRSRCSARAFPPITTTPYAIMLAPYGFFWFSLVRDPKRDQRADPLDGAPRLPTIVVPRAGSRFDRWARAAIDNDLVPLALGASEHGRVVDAFAAPELRPGARAGRHRRRVAAHLAAAALRVGRTGARERRRPRASGPREGWIVRRRPPTPANTAPLIERAMRDGVQLHDGGTSSRLGRRAGARSASTPKRLGSETGAQRWINPRRRAAAHLAPSMPRDAEQRRRRHAPPARPASPNPRAPWEPAHSPTPKASAGRRDARKPYITAPDRRRGVAARDPAPRRATKADPQRAQRRRRSRVVARALAGAGQRTPSSLASIATPISSAWRTAAQAIWTPGRRRHRGVVAVQEASSARVAALPTHSKAASSRAHAGSRCAGCCRRRRPGVRRIRRGRRRPFVNRSRTWLAGALVRDVTRERS